MLVGWKYLVLDAVTLLPPSGALVSSGQYLPTQTGRYCQYVGYRSKGMRTYRSSLIMVSLSPGIEGLLGASSACLGGG